MEAKNKIYSNIPIVIMAGGIGSRLSPLTDNLPKALLKHEKKPIIDKIISSFATQGSSEFYLILNHLHQLIIDHIDTRLQEEHTFRFIIEQEKHGTIGGLSLIDKTFTSPVVVTNCDVLIDVSYSEILNYHIKAKNDITVVFTKIEAESSYGVLEIDENNDVIDLKEKPKRTIKVLVGLYILSPEAINTIPVKTYFHITELIQKLISKKKKVGSFEIDSKKLTDFGIHKD